MAQYRTINTDFWINPHFIDSFTPEDRYFWLWLRTNPHVRQCGIYRVSVRQMEMELGYSAEAVKNLLKRFIQEGIIRYNTKTKELAIKNWLTENAGRTPDDKINICIRRELTDVEDTTLIEFVNGGGNEAHPCPSEGASQDPPPPPSENGAEIRNYKLETNNNSIHSPEEKSESENAINRDELKQYLLNNIPLNAQERANGVALILSRLTDPYRAYCFRKAVDAVVGKMAIGKAPGPFFLPLLLKVWEKCLQTEKEHYEVKLREREREIAALHREHQSLKENMTACEYCHGSVTYTVTEEMQNRIKSELDLLRRKTGREIVFTPPEIGSIQTCDACRKRQEGIEKIERKLIRWGETCPEPAKLD